jgi:hypothetical protein
MTPHNSRIQSGLFTLTQKMPTWSSPTLQPEAAEEAHFPTERPLPGQLPEGRSGLFRF